MKFQKFFAVFLFLALTAGCSPQATPIPAATAVNLPGFKYYTPEDWTRLPPGEGQCEENNHCVISKEGALLSVEMTPEDVHCPGVGSLSECLNRIETSYKNTQVAYNRTLREDYTSSFGLTGEVLEYTIDNGAMQVTEFWTHHGGLKIRVRYQAPPVIFQTLDDLIPLTFLSVRPNTPKPEASETPTGATPEATPASPAP